MHTCTVYTWIYSIIMRTFLNASYQFKYTATQESALFTAEHLDSDPIQPSHPSPTWQHTRSRQSAEGLGQQEVGKEGWSQTDRMTSLTACAKLISEIWIKMFLPVLPFPVNILELQELETEPRKSFIPWSFNFSFRFLHCCIDTKILLSC